MKLKSEVLSWAEARNLLNPENKLKQFAKTVSEVGELGDALIKQDHAATVDAIGDVLVTIIILSDQCGLDVEECLKSAYNEIKNRTGKTVGGTFIKDE